MMELILNETYKFEIEKEAEVEIIENALRLELQSEKVSLADKIKQFFTFEDKRSSKNEKIKNSNIINKVL